MTIVRGNAFGEDHVEIKRAKELGLTVLSYPETVIPYLDDIAFELTCELFPNYSDIYKQIFVRIRDKALNETEIPVNLILCAMRGDDEETRQGNLETLNVATKYFRKDHGVVAIDLAGAEALFSTDLFEDYFKQVREKNIPITIHAGEAADYHSVDSAIKFGAKRIGDCVNAIQSNSTMEEILKQEILIDVCLTSDIHTHAVEKIEDHPVKKFMEKGIYLK